VDDEFMVVTPHTSDHCYLGSRKPACIYCSIAKAATTCFGSPTLLYVKNKWSNDEWNSLSMILAGEVGNEGHHPVISTGVKNRNGMLSRDHVR
jgi:hypothetical protein